MFVITISYWVPVEVKEVGCHSEDHIDYLPDVKQLSFRLEVFFLLVLNLRDFPREHPVLHCEDYVSETVEAPVDSKHKIAKSPDRQEVLLSIHLFE